MELRTCLYNSLFVLVILFLHLSSIEASTDSESPTVQLEAESQFGFDKEKGETEESVRSLMRVCVPLLRRFKLKLRKPLSNNERVGLSGDHPRLGAWDVNKSLRMRKKSINGLLWQRKVPMCASGRIHYRYFIYSIDQYGNKRIRKWEGLPHARVMQRYEFFREPGLDVFGEVYGIIGGGQEQEDGWLRNEYVIELKFIWQRHIKFYQSYNITSEKKLRLHLSVLKGSTTKYNWQDTEIYVSRYIYKRSRFKKVSNFGVRYVEGEIVVFRVIEQSFAKNIYQLKILNSNKTVIGEVVILPTDIKFSEGVLKLPIAAPGSSNVIGFIKLPYLLITPLPNSSMLNLRGSFRNFWPLNWPSLDIGHRGSGKSFYRSEAVRIENTIKSFQFIHRVRGDMVELDVQLTKDLVPVLWHDYGFFTASHGQRIKDENDLRYTLIEDVFYQELKSMRVFAYKNSYIYEYTKINVMDPTILDRIFPTLADTFSSSPKALGMIVKIKWPQLKKNGKREFNSNIDKNRYVDAVLQASMRYGCGRPLIFASFDADICTMVNHKQNVFPVIFYTAGESYSDMPLKDLRAHTFINAVNLAQSENLLGTAAHSLLTRKYVNDAEMLNLGLDLFQTVFIWGHNLNKTVEYYKGIPVSGIIYDGIDLKWPTMRRIRFFDTKVLLELFARQCTAVGNMTSEEEISQRKYLHVTIFSKDSSNHE